MDTKALERISRGHPDAKELNRRLNRKLRTKLNEADADTRGFHSRAYHKHFEGYVETKRTTPSGRMRIERVYIGPRYRQAVSGAVCAAVRIGYLALFAVMAALLVSVGLMCTEADTVWYTALPELATILALTAMGYTLLVNYLFVPRSMTVGDYKSASVSLRREAVICAACFGADCLGTLLYLLLHPGTGETGPAALAAVRFIAGVLPALAMYFAEKHMPYEVTEGKEAPEGDGVEITV